MQYSECSLKEGLVSQKISHPVGCDVKVKPQVGPMGKALSFYETLYIFIAEKRKQVNISIYQKQTHEEVSAQALK